jgi:monoterpene epsilon-lactone hydrolase
VTDQLSAAEAARRSAHPSSASLGETLHLGPARASTLASGAALRLTVKPTLYAVTQVGRVVNLVDKDILQRTSLAGLDAPRRLSKPVAGTVCEPVQLPTCDAEWIAPGSPAHRSGATIIYFHGSAFVALGLNSHRPFASRLARATGAQVLNVAYGLRPKHDLEDAVQHGIDAYHHAISRGVDPSRIVLAGDSAGGFMAAMVAIRMRELGLPMPAGQVLMSPATDSALEPKLECARRRPDDMFPIAMARFLWRVYITRNGTHEVEDGPVDCDLTELGPFLIQVGSTEMLRHDAELLTARLREAGVRVDLQVWDRAPHVFQMIGAINADARDATRAVCDFIRTVTDTTRIDREPRRRRRGSRARMRLVVGATQREK